MSSDVFSKKYIKTSQSRYNKTLSFLDGLISENDAILDLGPSNPFSYILKSNGFIIENTPIGLDLDLDYNVVKEEKYDVVTAFEIIEHLVSPFPMLQSIKACKLIASVPLNLWFAKAYWNEKDPYDRHYHEFEARQFDMLLEKAGWKILKSEKWKSKSNKIGFRPFLRGITDRYYIVYCERK